MPRVTLTLLEGENQVLRGNIRELRQDNELLRAENRIMGRQLDMMQKYISTMIVGSEKLSDALSHTIGFLSDPKRLQAMTQTAVDANRR